jgi:hypothetical protein
MYGMVNQAVRGLVMERFGSQTWTQIHTGAGAPENFSAMQPYEDSVTYDLVGKAVEILGLPAETILRAFGEYWVLEIATKHYGTLMTSTGRDFADFLANLDHMHQRIRVTFPNYQPPSFRVKPLDSGTLQVDYYSHRLGLLPFVEGLFTGLAQYFSVTVSFENVPNESHQLPCKRLLVRYAKAA